MCSPTQRGEERCAQHSKGVVPKPGVSLSVHYARYETALGLTSTGGVWPPQRVQLMVLTSHGREAEALCNPFISHASHPTMYGKELKITSKGFGSSALEVTTPRGVCLSFLPGNREPLTEEVPGKTILVGNKVLLRRPERRTRS